MSNGDILTVRIIIIQKIADDYNDEDDDADGDDDDDEILLFTKLVKLNTVKLT
jgi:hypothetical protein